MMDDQPMTTRKEDLDLLRHVARSFGVMRPAIQSGEDVVREDIHDERGIFGSYEFRAIGNGAIRVRRTVRKKSPYLAMGAIVQQTSEGVSAKHVYGAGIANVPRDELVQWIRSLISLGGEESVNAAIEYQACVLFDSQLDALTTSRTNDQIRAIATEENRRRGRPTLW